MSDEITWIEAVLREHGGTDAPAFQDDGRSDRTWWRQNADLRPPKYQWRSYERGREEVARMLFVVGYASHLSSAPAEAVLIWNFEVREDLRCSGDHIGTRIVQQFIDEHGDQEVYIGPTPTSHSFWERFGWPLCDCDRCWGPDYFVRPPSR